MSELDKSGQVVHIVSSEIVSEVLTTIIQNFSINNLILIGEQKEVKFPIVSFLPKFKEEFSYEYLAEIKSRILSISSNKEIMICLDEPTPLFSSYLFLLSVSLNAKAYHVKPNLITFSKIPILEIKDQELKILSILQKYGGTVEEYGTISAEAGWGPKNSAKGVGRVSYITRKLENYGLVTTKKEGKTVSVDLTSKGKSYLFLTK